MHAASPRPRVAPALHRRLSRTRVCIPHVDCIFEGKDGSEGALRAFANCEPPDRDAYCKVFVRWVPFQLMYSLLRGRVDVGQHHSFFGCIAALGGPARVSTLLKLVKCDPNMGGHWLDKAELEQYKRQGIEFVGQVVANCQTMSVVGTLVVGLTHQSTIGRPAVWQPSADFVDSFGQRAADICMWLGYTANLYTELAAITLLLFCITIRQLLVAILPNLQSKLKFIRKANPSGLIATMLTAVIIGLWATIALGGVLSSPRWGFVAVGGAIIVPPFYSWFVSDFYYEALLDLHEEARKVVQLHDNQKKFGSLDTLPLVLPLASPQSPPSKPIGEVPMSKSAPSDSFIKMASLEE